MSSNIRATTTARGASLMPDSHHGLNFSGALGDILEIVKSRSFKATFVIAVFIAFLLSPKAWLFAAIDHEIEQINIHGQLTNLDVSDVNQKLSGVLGSSFLTADLEQIKQDVESLAWVKHATVSRVWPSKIVLAVDEQYPVAYWNEHSYLNSEGEVFSPEFVDFKLGLPLLKGPEASELQVREELLREIASIRSLLLPHQLEVTELQVDERGGWTMRLSDGIEVALGEQPFHSKIERLGALMKQSPEVAIGRMERVDTRYPNGVAVKWKDVTLAAGN